jgi:MarR family transcriptional regulator, organic hydroperoxide resistance regulator
MKNSPFSVDTAEQSAGLLLWQTTTLWQRLIKKALEEYSIPHSQFVIMATLLWFEKQNYETTQIAIADWTKLDKMTVSKSLKQLIQLNLVKRKEHTRDTRAKTISLTAKGKTLIIQLIPIVEEIDAQFFRAIPVKQHNIFLTFLNKLIKVHTI